MLVSFASVLWYGTKVARLFWKLSNDMASMSVEHQRQNGRHGITKTEIAVFTIIWVGFLMVVFTLWCYDHYVDNSFVGYGMDINCLIAGDEAKGYLVILPISVMCLYSIGTVLFSLFHYVSLMRSDSSKSKKLVIFVGRLIVFQSTQWVFGVIFYFTNDEIIRYLFEVSVAFEGLLIAFSMYARYLVAVVKVGRVEQA